MAPPPPARTENTTAHSTIRASGGITRPQGFSSGDSPLEFRVRLCKIGTSRSPASSPTLLGLLSVGAVLPVLPRYVTGPLDSGDIAVGVVIGCYAVTGLLLRPIAGRIADTRGRRPTLVVGSLLAAGAGLLYLVPAGIPGLIVARLFLGAGEGMVFTAGSAWIVDLAPKERRGRVIGLYGLAVWAGSAWGR